MESESEESPEVFAAVYGPPGDRRMKLLVPKDHSLNESFVREWGPDSEEAVSAGDIPLPNLTRRYRQYSVAYDDRAHRFIMEHGFPLVAVETIGEGLAQESAAREAARAILRHGEGRKNAAESILATPLKKLSVVWNTEDGSPPFPVSPSNWQENAALALAELHESLGHLHLDERYGCNSRHALEAMDGIARLRDLLGKHFPLSGPGARSPGKKWEPYFDQTLEALKGLHKLYHQQRRVMQAIERRLGSIEQGLSARHLTPEGEDHGE